jgi:hypothetical protein
MTSVRAIYERGRVRFLEPLRTPGRHELIVIFLGDEETDLPLDDGKVPRTKKDGWPAGYFRRTAGCLRHNPIRRAPQGELERRKAVR